MGNVCCTPAGIALETQSKAATTVTTGSSGGGDSFGMAPTQTQQAETVNSDGDKSNNVTKVSGVTVITEDFGTPPQTSKALAAGKPASNGDLKRLSAAPTESSSKKAPKVKPAKKKGTKETRILIIGMLSHS